MKVTDKAIARMVNESPGHNISEPNGGLDTKIDPEAEPLLRGEGNMARRTLTDAACHSGGVVRDSTVTRTC